MDDILTSNFKAAALAVTQLFKDAQKDKAKSFQAGYIQCFEDLLTFIGVVPNESNTDLTLLDSSAPSESTPTIQLTLATLDDFVRSKRSAFQSSPFVSALHHAAAIEGDKTGGSLPTPSLSSSLATSLSSNTISHTNLSSNCRSNAQQPTSPKSPALTSKTVASPPSPTSDEDIIIPASTLSQLPPIFTFSASIPDTFPFIQKPHNHYQHHQQLKRNSHLHHRPFGSKTPPPSSALGLHHHQTSSATASQTHAQFLDALSGLGLGNAPIPPFSTAPTPASSTNLSNAVQTTLNDLDVGDETEMVYPGESLKRRWTAAPDVSGLDVSNFTKSKQDGIKVDGNGFGFGHLSGPDFKRARWRKEMDEDMNE
jgi:hypothetical protein